MDTSPGFAQQMDCVILAYQSDASVDVLNSVVTQNLWVQRRLVDGKGAVEADVETKKKDAETQTLAGEEFVKRKGVGGKGDKVRCRLKTTEEAATLHNVTADKDKVVTHKGGKKDSQTKKVNAESRASDATDPVSGDARTTPVDTTALETTIPAKAKSTHLSKSTSLCPQVTDKLSESSRMPGLNSTTKIDSRTLQADSIANTSTIKTKATVVSRPREWGKRKRLVTRNQLKPTKRVRKAPLQPSDQSSTATDNSDDEKAGLGKRTNWLSDKGRLTTKKVDANAASKPVQHDKPGSVQETSKMETLAMSSALKVVN
ncbi:unnamed protein product [Phytophthora lilii]|uniref:Unnamed protein product n=1 Tax=Phytophthora lilii TaxID=2077276 RepID=A0A9W6TY86_9STRA|nr:unnamed protein product [Phytophthora lilii]